MKKTILLAIMAIVFLTEVNAQKIFYQTQDKAAELAAKNIFSQLKNIEVNQEQKIVILPIYNKKKEISDESEYLSNKITNKLNLLLQKSDLKFRVFDYKEDVRLRNELESGTVADHNDSKYYEDLLQKYQKDFAISAIYIYDAYKNNFIIENITISANHFITGTDKKQISAESVSEANTAGVAPIWRTALIPGWGQMYKGQKGKSAIMLGATAILASAYAISHVNYGINLDKAKEYLGINNSYYLTYKENYEYWDKTRTIVGVGAGIYYVYSLIDVFTTRVNKSYVFNSNKLKFYPNINKNYYSLSLNLKF